MTGRYVTPSLSVDPDLQHSPAPDVAAAMILADRDAIVAVQSDEDARAVLRILGFDDKHIETQLNWGKYNAPVAP